MRRLYYYAPAFSAATGADLEVVRAAALLHDATKEDGEGTPARRFCTHGEQGAVYARRVLNDLGAAPAFVDAVVDAIREHMGPLGFNPDLGAPRFMSKFCAQDTFPTPRSLEAQVLYDLDMLDLMTVDGVTKVVELRQKGAEFGKETLRQSAEAGADSAWKSVLDAKQTLRTPAAQACGDALAAHSRAFLDGVRWEQLGDLSAFKNAAAEFLQARPLPACLPQVPACSTDDSSEEGPCALPTGARAGPPGGPLRPGTS